VISALLAEFPGFRGVRDAAPSSDFRMNGRRIPRKSLRETGRTAVTANVDVREPAPPIDADSPLAWTMEGRAGQPPSSLIPRFWAPGWNSDQSLHKFQIEVGGPLRDGDPGVRLFEPPAVAAHVSHGTVPPAFAARDGLLLLVPRHHLFGSEELSALSPGIARRSPAPYIAMGRQDAERFGVREGKLALVSWQDAGAGRAATMRCTVVMGNLPPGIAAAPRGIPGMTGVAMPAFVRVTGVET
jgi:NADH-quinone oxidoreductase subunit G